MNKLYNTYLHRKIFCAIILIFTFSFFTIEPTSAQSDLTYEIIIGSGITNACDTVNLGVKVSGGTPPYRVTYLPDPTQPTKSLPNSSIMGTWLWEVPEEGMWTGFLFMVEDNAGNIVSNSHNINVIWSFDCNTSVIKSLSLNAQNDLDHPYGQSCAINGTIDWDDGFLWGFPQSSPFTIYNSEGDTLYHDNQLLKYPSSNFTIPESSIPQEEYKDNDVTKKVYLSVQIGNDIFVNSGFWVQPIHLYPDTLIRNDFEVTKCDLTDDSDFGSWIHEVGTEHFGSPYCIGSNESETIEWTAQKSRSFTIQGGGEIEAGSVLGKKLSLNIGGAYEWGWGQSLGNSKTWDFSDCYRCQKS